MPQTQTQTTRERHKVVSPEEWLAARQKFLEREKNYMRMGDALSAARRELPWVRVEKDYVFDSPTGKKSLADLFDGRSQLVVYHFMFGPGWEEGCPGCSYLSDHIDGILSHLANRDVAYAAISRATVSEIEAFRNRMGWRFPWLSSNQNDFNYDFHVSFTKEEMENGEVYYNFKKQKNAPETSSAEAPGFSVFYEDEDGAIFHTYSTYGRGGELALGTYRFLDIVPKGRDEASLPFPMAWVRHHDKYTAQPTRPEVSWPQDVIASASAKKVAKDSCCQH
jgi:predicted dithiol-disulfide oxidoreductase (DUF899 family)